MDKAVNAASKAFIERSQTTGKVRSVYLNKIADEIEKQKDYLVQLEVLFPSPHL